MWNRRSRWRSDPEQADGGPPRLRAALVGVLAAALLVGCTADNVREATAPDAAAPASSAGAAGEGTTGDDSKSGDAQADAAQGEGGDARLAPGRYLPPLARLHRLEGEKTHLHVDEVRYLAQNIKHKLPDSERTPGCIRLAWDGDIVYTTHRGNLSNPAFLSGWDIAKTDSPRTALASTSGTRRRTASRGSAS